MSDVEDTEEKKRVHVTSSDSDQATKDEPMKARLRAKRAKASNIHSSSSEEDNSDDDKKNKKKGKKAGRKNGKASSEEDIEEGELSDESSEEEPQFDDGYDDNLIGDEADRERLSTMTEREREQEIFKRLEHREMLKRRFELEKKLKMRQKSGGMAKGPGGAVEDTSARSKERRLMVEGKKDTKAKAIENLRAAREEKRNRAAEQEKKKAAAKGGSIKKERNDTDSDDEENLKDVERKKVDTSSDDSDSDESNKSVKQEEKDHRLEPIKNMADLEKIRLSRFRMVKWIYLPFLADAVKGCFVRVNFGDSPTNNAPVCRLAEILGVLEAPKPYELKGEGGPKDVIKTSLMLRLRVFERERQMNLTFLSNQPLTEGEFEDFKNKMLEKDLSLPNMEHVERKMMDIKRANTYRMTDADITTMVAAKEKLGMKPQNLAMRKAELLKQKVLAEDNGDTTLLTQIAVDLKEIDVQSAGRHAVQNNQTKIEAINKRNRNSAIEALGKALSVVDKEKRDVERVAEDPFTRRWGTPLLVHKKTLNGSATPAAEKKEETKASDKAATPAVIITATVDPFNMHNFDIGLHIDMDDFPVASSASFRRGK